MPAAAVAFARRHRIPVYATPGTLHCLARRSASNERLLAAGAGHPVDAGSSFAIGDIAVRPVTVPHDAREPVQYVFDHRGARLGVLSDLGHATPHVIRAYSGCRLLFVESNHDLDMLWSGTYPLRLKRRIASDFGHLANDQAVEFVRRVLHDGLTHLVVGHLSEQNNSPQHVETAFPGAERALHGVRRRHPGAGHGLGGPRMRRRDEDRAW